MPNALRVVFGRLMGALAAGLVGWFCAKVGIDIPDEDRHKVVEFVVGFGMTIVLGVYSLVHKLVDRWVNPLDTARSRTADPQTAAGVVAAHAPNSTVK